MLPRSHTIQSQIIKDLSLHVPEKNVVFILCGCLFGLFIFIPAENVIQYNLLKGVQLLLLFLLGMLYMASLKTVANKPGDGKSYLIFIAGVIALMLTAVYLQTERADWFFALSSSAGFALPACLRICWKYFQVSMKKNQFSIPQRRSSVLTPAINEIIFLNLKIQTKADSLKGYTTEASCNKKLKDFFSEFLYDLKDDASFILKANTTNNDAYAWEFFVLNLEGLQLQKIDPNLTLTENKIEPYSTLVIKPLQSASIPVNPKLSTYEYNKQ